MVDKAVEMVGSLLPDVKPQLRGMHSRSRGRSAWGSGSRGRCIVAGSISLVGNGSPRLLNSGHGNGRSGAISLGSRQYGQRLVASTDSCSTPVKEGTAYRKTAFPALASVGEEDWSENRVTPTHLVAPLPKVNTCARHRTQSPMPSAFLTAVNPARLAGSIAQVPLGIPVSVKKSDLTESFPSVRLIIPSYGYICQLFEQGIVFSSRPSLEAMADSMGSCDWLQRGCKLRCVRAFWCL